MVLPSACIVCAEELPWRARSASCCAKCWAAMPRIVEPKCRFCAAVWITSERNARYTCGRCMESPPPLDWLDAWGHYAGGLEVALRSLKFNRHDFLAAPLAGLLMETLEARGDDAFDCIVPVPMHPRRERRRGFNQAQILAAHLDRGTRLRMRTDLIRKVRVGRPQSSLPRAEREANVRGSFVATASARDLSILIVDDVCTTGETIRTCATALLDAGAARVCGLVVARA